MRDAYLREESQPTTMWTVEVHDVVMGGNDLCKKEKKSFVR